MLRILNEDGSRPPLLWIFNTAKEPLDFARVLGEDQPLIFSRSSHLIVQPDDDPMKVRKILTDYVVQEVHKRFSGVHFDMGTSCQGGGMVMSLSNSLREVGIGVGHLCMINCSLPEIVTNLPALLVYGDKDEGHDPFQRDLVSAKERAELVFSSHRRSLISARHGQFYSQAVSKEIVAQFELFRSQAHPE